MKFTPVISHIFSDGNWHIQTNSEHCNGTAQLATLFADEFGMGEWGRMLGLLHDRGKECEGFQAHIRQSSGYDSTARSTQSSHHSFVGAILAHSIPLKDSLFWLSNPIAGHHGGLYDTDELEMILGERQIPEGISVSVPDINLPLPRLKLQPQDSAHICRMLFSCLVDADWLDTERFMDRDKFGQRGSDTSIHELLDKMEHQRKKFGKLPDSQLNNLRNQIQNICEKAAEYEPGFFDLTVPTGGGKTIASVIWALHHAVRHGKKRVIIAIPYTSIIVQTARVLKDIFGDENVIEHHSLMSVDDSDDTSMLVCENWDAPIIVTTNVQLFESMFSCRRSSCRKLHSICNSVVILDEIQTLPLSLIQPIVDAMQSYVRLFGVSFLFSTATQPILHGNHKGCSGSEFKGIDGKVIRSIISPSMDLHDRLRRVRISIRDEEFDVQELAQQLGCHSRVLCVVSSRRYAFELFKALPDDGIPAYHLSRSMCPAHILSTIQDIKNVLKDPEAPVRVVSTQLVEAGVDIDFPVVFRQMAGLDSILQAAGRCNREGKLEMGEVIVFSFKEDNSIGYIRFASDTMRDMVSQYPDADWLSPEFIKLYYQKLYSRIPSFDKEDVTALLGSPKNCRYEEASRRFRLIDEDGKNIIVSYGEGPRIIERIRHTGLSRALTRELSRYSVNVPTYMFDKYVRDGLVEETIPGMFHIPLESQYDLCTGLKVTNDYLDNQFII